VTEHRNGGAAVVETLAVHGVDTVFGIPGTHNLEIYRHFPTSGIRAVTPRHEQGAGYAAEAYARVTGRPGVVVATSGPGVTNTMTAAATAYAESQPMLILSSGMPTGTEGRDLGQLHETKNVSAAMDQLVRWSRRVASADEAAEAISEAFGSFTGGRPRPVHIEIPVDVLEQTWAGKPQLHAKTQPPLADPAAIRRAADALAAGLAPMIIAGGGAVDAQPELTALAEALGAPVVTTVNGKGAVDEAHPMSVGASIRLRAAQKAAADSDALLVIGSELGDSDLWGGSFAVAPSSAATSTRPSSTRTARPTTRCWATQPPCCPHCWSPFPRIERRHHRNGPRCCARHAARKLFRTRDLTQKSTPQSVQRCPTMRC
jgi:thiamine pyrophosphate-dependent acetolactate synthase large subunit-like protein